MKNNKIKKILVILIVVLISIISFVGIFIQNKNVIENILLDYSLGMDLEGYRRIELNVNLKNKTVNYDENDNIIESSDTETKVVRSEEKPVNNQEVLNEENYKKAKEIIEKRFAKMQVSDYIIKQDIATGNIIIQIPEDSNTDRIVSQLQLKGKFEIVDADTKEVLMTNSDIKSVKSGYGTTSSNTTTVFINIQFNKDGTKKFKDITNKYIQTTEIKEKENEEEEAKEETITKKISIKIDDSELLTTYFDKEVSDGLLQLSVGSTTSTTTNEELQEYLVEANSMATLIDSGNMNVEYEIEQNKYVFSDITKGDLNIVICIGVTVLTILAIYLIIKYKKNGIFAAISLIGYIAVLAIVIRYANVVITIEAIVGIIISIILNCILINMLLSEYNKKDIDEEPFWNVYKKYTMIIIPIWIIAIVFTFASWLPIFSIGMTIFWGITVNLLYNLVITKILLDNK